MNQKRFDLSRDYLKRIRVKTPEILVMMAQVYLSLEDKASAVEKAQELLAGLENGIFEEDRVGVLSYKVTAYIILASGRYMTNEQIVLLDKGFKALEDGVKYIDLTSDGEAQISKSYVQLSRVYLSLNLDEGMRKGLICLSRSIRKGGRNNLSGSILLYSCNQAGGYYVSLKVAQEMLVNGQALVASHLRLGLDAWRVNNDRLAKLHFEIAQNINPATSGVLRDVARSLAQLNDAAIVDSVRFSLKNERPWVTALGLLDLLVDVEGRESPQTLITRCEILASRQKWPQLSVRLEPKLDIFPKKLKIRALNLLSVANREMFDLEKAEKYTKMREELLKEQPKDGLEEG